MLDRLTRASTAAAAAALALGLAGCGSSSGPPAATQVAAPATSTPAAAPSPAAVVTRVSLVAGDLATGYTVKLIPGGDQVQGQVTLDNCGYTFTTEAHRVARRQVAIFSPTGARVGAANEVVAYDSPAQAAKALTEFRASVQRCPKGVFEQSTVAGTPDLRYDASTIATVPGLPVQDNAVATIAVTAKGSGQRLYGVLIFQRQGSVLDGVYLQSPTKPTAADIAAVRALAAITGKRLATV
jgi:hypothetical protein